jgi:hypothetical protein
MLVERKTQFPVGLQSPVPAKRFVSLTARDQTFVLGRPELAAVQVVPLLVERKTPPG